MRPPRKRMSGVSRRRALADVSQFLARCLSAWYSQGRWYLDRGAHAKKEHYVGYIPRRDLRRLRHCLRFKLAFGLFLSLRRALGRSTMDRGRPLGSMASYRATENPSSTTRQSFQSEPSMNLERMTKSFRRSQRETREQSHTTHEDRRNQGINSVAEVTEKREKKYGRARSRRSSREV
ncbi:uncharacterized protein LOC143179593 [Calliopsis andreniformis]|uniref:uncharacterized protein LOC143179593 n=1 Tax=Calliopsis andreniformis TaxID=337506 RepID=UPI003FCE55A6